MRGIALAVLMLAAAASHAETTDDGWKLVTLTLKKSGACSGTMTVTERDTHYAFASCRLGCNEVTLQIPKGTWLRVSTQAAAQCSGGPVFVNGTVLEMPRALAGALPGPAMVQVGEKGAVITTTFRWRHAGAIQ